MHTLQFIFISKVFADHVTATALTYNFPLSTHDQLYIAKAPMPVARVESLSYKLVPVI